MKTTRLLLKAIFPIAAVAVLAIATSAQTTAFKYQGSLTDAGSPANGNFQMQFKLFDAVSGGAQIGATLTDLPVTATNGVFAVSLDFGVAALSGANRWLEISVRRNSGESYVTLSPRELITSSPYAVRTLSAASADMAMDSQKLGGVNASEYVTTSTVGSAFVKNDTVVQTANFNISGNGFVGGNFGIGTTAPTAKLQVVGGGFPNNLRITDNNTTATALDLTNTSSGGRPWRFQSVGSGVTGRTGNLEIWEASTGTSPSLALQSNGNVGIGTSSPARTFHVRGSGFRYEATDGKTLDIIPGTILDIVAQTDSLSIASRGPVGNNHLILNPYPNDGTPPFRNGNVGIGTFNPTQKFQVDSGQMLVRGTTNFATNGDRAALYFGDTNHYISGVRGSGVRIGTFSAPDAIALAEGSGNVGIGTTAPTAKLHVNGDSAQPVDKGGFVKALVSISDNGTLLRCYNGVTGQSTGDCGGIQTFLSGTGGKLIVFPFSVSNRFISATLVDNGGGVYYQGVTVGAKTTADTALVYTCDAVHLTGSACTPVDRSVFVVIY